VVALLASLVSFTHVVAGLTNGSLRGLVEAHLGRPYSSRQMTYDLRRLTRKGLIAREKGTHRYRLTPQGRRLAMFFTKTYTRIITPSLGYLDPALPPEISTRAPVARAWRDLDRALDKLIVDSGIAA
jgi:DNA-binding PadR family transcriptional regulator